MKVYSKASLLLSVAMLVGAPSAFGQECAPTQDPNICVTVSSQPSTVTFSRDGAPSLVTYLVTIANNSASYVRRVRFGGDTEVRLSDSTLSTEPAPFVDPDNGADLTPGQAYPVFVTGDSDIVVNCTVTSATRIDCPALSEDGFRLEPSQKASFAVAVRAPTAGAKVIFVWDAQFAEGSANGVGAQNGTGEAADSTETTLEAPANDSVKTFVPTLGSDVRTGFGAIPTSTDPFTTTVEVKPEPDSRITAEIRELSAGSGSCPGNAAACSKIDVLKAGTTDKAAVGDGLRSILVITLRWDATVSRGNVKNKVIYYQPLDIPGVGDPVKSCDEFVDGLPLPGIPCIKQRISYTQKYVRDLGFPTGLINDQGIEIWAIDNGRFTIDG